MALGCRSQLAAGLTGKKKAISISPRGVLRMIDAVGGVARAFLEQALMTDLRVALGDTPTGPGNKYRSKILSKTCLLYTSPSPRDRQKSRMPSFA